MMEQQTNFVLDNEKSDTILSYKTAIMLNESKHEMVLATNIISIIQRHINNEAIQNYTAKTAYNTLIEVDFSST